jgi:HAL2 family 3'(2'),5'-bisphosphate nucleotidase
MKLMGSEATAVGGLTRSTAVCERSRMLSENAAASRRLGELSTFRGRWSGLRLLRLVSGSNECRKRIGSTLGTPTDLLDPRIAVGDYTSQALVSALLFSHFPSDQIVGEEDSSELQKPDNANTKAQIVRLATEAMKEPLPIAEEEAHWEEVKSVERGEKEWLDIIDRGNSTGGASGRHWALDPIDGTKGFLRGGQYAVCLGLLKDGEVVLGVMGCPNLPVDPKNPDGEKGALFVAVKGEGAFQVRSLSPFLASCLVIVQRTVVGVSSFLLP